MSQHTKTFSTNAKQYDNTREYDYTHLFRLAQERLETLCKDCTSKQQDKVNEIKEIIRYYKKHGNLGNLL